MVCENSRNEIPCELPGICTLVYANQNFYMKDHYISLDQDRYATYIVAKYLDTARVKTSKFFYEINFTSVMIFTKTNASTSDDQV